MQTLSKSKRQMGCSRKHAGHSIPEGGEESFLEGRLPAAKSISISFLEGGSSLKKQGLERPREASKGLLGGLVILQNDKNHMNKAPRVITGRCYLILPLAVGIQVVLRRPSQVSNGRESSVANEQGTGGGV